MIIFLPYAIVSNSTLLQGLGRWPGLHYGATPAWVNQTNRDTLSEIVKFIYFLLVNSE